MAYNVLRERQHTYINVYSDHEWDCINKVKNNAEYFDYYDAWIDNNVDAITIRDTWQHWHNYKDLIIDGRIKDCRNGENK